jgi:magnesium chelatase family protein
MVLRRASVLRLASMISQGASGYFNDGKSGSVTPFEMQRYLGKISGPLLDRIDLHVEVEPVPFEKLSETRPAESSASIRSRVTEARKLQTQRFKNTKNTHYNAQMSNRQIRKYCSLDQDSSALLKSAMERLSLSARAYDRILKVSRTLADLAGKDKVDSDHISEAIQYRSLDREGWLA